MATSKSTYSETLKMPKSSIHIITSRGNAMAADMPTAHSHSRSTHPLKRMARHCSTILLALLAFGAPVSAQQGITVGEPYGQWFTNAGAVCNACKLNFYITGTSTRLDTYTDAALTTPHANPVVLDSAGRALIYLGDRVYKVVLTTSADVVIWTADPHVGRAPPANVLSKATNYTVAVTDGKDVLILCDTSGGAVTITLYTAVGNTGRFIRVKKSDSSANPCTVDANGSQTIDGALTKTINNQYQNLEVVSDGANWQTLGVVDRSVAPGTCTCRLTLTTGTAITTADVTNSNLVYLTPYKGTRVTLYNGTDWVLHTLSEVTLNLTNETISGGVNYDIFLYLVGVTLTLERLAWTNDTTRATALATQDGVYVQSGATTRLYVGTIRGSGANATSDSLLERFTSSYYNPQPRPMAFRPTQDNYTYSTATWRQANGDATAQLAFVVGVEERPVEAHYYVVSVDSGGNARSAGIGLDSTTVATSGGRISALGAGASVLGEHHAALSSFPGVGYHYMAALEIGNGSTTTTWYGDNGAPTTHQNGIFGLIWN